MKTPEPAPPPSRPIVCGTDLCATSRPALLVAGALARRLGEPLLLVHAIEAGALGPSAASVLAELTASRQKNLRTDVLRLRQTGAAVQERLVNGRAEDVLVKLAREEDARLLVVASAARRGAAWFVGHVAERAVERSAQPVLVVRDAAPLVAWARGRRPLKVFVCSNFTATAETALRWLAELPAIGPIEVVVGYVNWPAEEWARLDGKGVLPLEGNTPTVQAVLERNLQARVAALLGPLPFRLRIEANWGRPCIRLADMAREEGADLVVAGSHQYRGFERLWHASVSRGLLHDAAMNVAIVPRSSDRIRPIAPAAPLRRVLVATDFSALADAAIPHAYSLLPAGGVLHLVHVVVPVPAPSSNPAQGRPISLDGEDLDRCLGKLRARILPEAAARGVTTQVEVLPGQDAAEEISRAAERLDVDAICLGSHGRSGLSRALLGSVAQKLMSLGSRPLFVVRQKPE